MRRRLQRTMSARWRDGCASVRFFGYGAAATSTSARPRRSAEFMARLAALIPRRRSRLAAKSEPCAGQTEYDAPV
ncbi:hypothetical protein BE20_00280 [Sorangium cellulosum]|nr:hypothetical protein BE20_00280 [Sorangium cellulosum]